MQYVLLILASVLSFSAWSTPQETVEIHAVRIGDSLSYAKEGDLGHCTGFLVENRLYTAGHCSHNQSFILINQQGRIFFDLEGRDKYFLKNEFGLLDGITLELTSEEVEIIKSNGTAVQIPARGIFIVGFPLFLRERSVTLLECRTFEHPTLVVKQAMERVLSNLHTRCDSMNHMDINNVPSLTHEQVKGMSGGPTAVDGKIVGITYHVDEPRGVYDFGAYKTLLLSDSHILQEESSARRSFQLDRRTLEQVKQPNKMLIDFQMFLLDKPSLVKVTLQKIESITPNATGWTLRMFDGQVEALERSQIPESLAKILERAF